jgi:hypothetical protein
MSDELNQDPNEWVPQGFFGPVAVATAAKAITDQDSRAGAWMPPQGAPPIAVDIDGTQAMFAVLTRRHSPIPTPEGLLQADPAMVGRLVNA